MQRKLGRIVAALAPATAFALVSLHATGCNDKKTHLPFVVPVAPTQIVRGNVPVFYTAVDTKNAPVQALFSVSADGGQTFKPATAAAGQPPQPIVAAHPMGAPNLFYWNSVADLGPGFHRNVVLSGNGLGSGGAGRGVSSGVFFVDDGDIFVAPAGSAGLARSNVLAFPLPDGAVYIVGGSANGALSSVGEVYDPVADAVTPRGGLTSARAGVAGAFLTSGRVLTVGGTASVPSSALSTAEFFDEAAGATHPIAGGLAVARYDAAVGALPGGRAVVAGGIGVGGALVNALEVYDPSAGPTGAFAVVTSSTGAAVDLPTATSLADGRVLFTGGADASGRAQAEAFLFDPTTATVTSAGQLQNARVGHRATLLSNGKVLVAGGQSTLGSSQALLATVEIFDPTTLTWSFAQSMHVPRAFHGQDYAGGRVLAVGGDTATQPMGTAEEYDQDLNLWRFTTFSPVAARPDAQAVATSSGRALVAGGGAPPEVHYPLDLPPPEAWIALAQAPHGRAFHTATPVQGGDVVLAGGVTGVASATASVERFHVTSSVFSIPQTRQDTFTSAASLQTARAGHAAVSLPNGHVLVIGGHDANGNVLGSLESYDPFLDAWQTQQSTLAVPRTNLHAVVLPTGDVLVEGGVDGTGKPVGTLEIFHWAFDGIESGPSLATPRVDDDVFVAFNGNVFIAGGADAAGNPVSSVEVFSSFNRTLSSPVSLQVARRGLALGPDPGGFDIDATGGIDGSGTTRADFEAIDPNVPTVLSGTFALERARAFHRLTSIEDRSLLLTGGRAGPLVLDATGIGFQPPFFGFGAFPSPATAIVRPTITTRMNSPRVGHTATLLGDGRVLVVGGIDHRGVVVAGAEYFLEPPIVFPLQTNPDQPLPPPPGPAFTVSTFPPGEGFGTNPFLTPNYPPGTPTFP